MKKTFSFRSASLRDETGKSLRLDRVEGGSSGGPRRRLLLSLFPRRKGGSAGQAAATIELSRREAYALAEWIDELVTRAPGS